MSRIVCAYIYILIINNNTREYFSNNFRISLRISVLSIGEKRGLYVSDNEIHYTRVCAQLGREFKLFADLMDSQLWLLSLGLRVN